MMAICEKHKCSFVYLHRARAWHCSECLCEERDEAIAEVESLQSQNLALAERVAAQFELLSRAAEKEQEAAWRLGYRAAECGRRGDVEGWVKCMRRLMVRRGLPGAPKQFEYIGVSQEFYDKLVQYQLSRADYFAGELAVREAGLRFRGVPIVVAEAS